MPRDYRKQIVYVFVMPHCQTELENVVPLTPENHTDFVTPEGLLIEDGYKAELCYGHYHFKKPLPLPEIASFVQQLGDSMDTRLYFALKKKGKIWEVIRSGEDDMIKTPDGNIFIESRADEAENDNPLLFFKN